MRGAAPLHSQQRCPRTYGQPTSPRLPPCRGQKAQGALLSPQQRAGGPSSKPRLLEPDPPQPPQEPLHPRFSPGTSLQSSLPRRLQPSQARPFSLWENLPVKQLGAKAEGGERLPGPRPQRMRIKSACMEMSFMTPAKLWMLGDHAGSTVHVGRIRWIPTAPM